MPPIRMRRRCSVLPKAQQGRYAGLRCSCLPFRQCNVYVYLFYGMLSCFFENDADRKPPPSSDRQQSISAAISDQDAGNAGPSRHAYAIAS